MIPSSKTIMALTEMRLISAGCASTAESSQRAISDQTLDEAMLSPGLTNSVRPLDEDEPIDKESVSSLEETGRIINQDLAAKGMIFISDFGQAKLAKGAGIELQPYHLILFDNPSLGIQLLTSNPISGLNRPVRLLGGKDAVGEVRVVGTNFDHNPKRRRIEDQDKASAMANDASSIMDNAGGH